MRRRGVSPPLPSPPRGGEARGLRPPLRRGRWRGRSGRIFAAFAAFSRFCLRLLRQKRAKRPNRQKNQRFSVDPGLFCVHPHTVRLAAASAGLGRSALRPRAAPCAALPPPVPARSARRCCAAAPRACGVVAVEGVSSRPTNKGRCASSPDRACCAFQRPAAPQSAPANFPAPSQSLAAP